MINNKELCELFIRIIYMNIYNIEILDRTRSLGEPSKLKKKYGIFHRRSGPPPPHEKYGKIQPIFLKLLTTYGGLFEKNIFFP